MRPFLIFLACLALYFAILSILAMQAGAMTLQITGSSTGQGLHNLTFWGEHLNATLQQGNNSTITINVTGGSLQ